MTIKKASPNSYNTVNSAAICGYIRDYSAKISAIIQSEKLESANRAALKACAAELETVLKRLERAVNGRY